MRTLIRVALCVLVTFAIASLVKPGLAQTWPSRPITLVVPFAAGSSSDTAARILSVGMSEALGQQMIVENVGGAAGTIGTVRVARAVPDGYQVLFGTVDTMAIAPALQKKPPYDSVNDFTPAGMAVEQPVVLIARKDLPVITLQEFTAYAKANYYQDAIRFRRRRIGLALLLCQAEPRAWHRPDPRALSQLGSRGSGFVRWATRFHLCARRYRYGAGRERPS